MKDEEVLAQLRRLSSSHGGSAAHLGRAASSDDVIRAEDELGVTIPGSYRLFLLEFGWGGVGDWELYGLGPTVPFHLNLVRLTCSERSEMMPPLPHHLLPIMNDGGGNLLCLDMARQRPDGENPIVMRYHENEDVEDLFSSLPAFLGDILDRRTND